MKNLLNKSLIFALLLGAISFSTISCDDDNDDYKNKFFEVSVTLDLTENDVLDATGNEIEDDTFTTEFNEITDVKLVVTSNDPNFEKIEKNMDKQTISLNKLKGGDYTFTVTAKLKGDDTCVLVGHETETIDENDVIDIDLDKKLLPIK